MWETRTFRTKDAMQKWIEKNEGRVQWEQIFINNGYGVTFRKLRIIG